MEIDGPKPNGRKNGHLPDEILEIMRIQRLQRTGSFLESLAAASLDTKLTLKLFTALEHVFPAVCSIWSDEKVEPVQTDGVIPAFARILHFAPHLSVFLMRYLIRTSPQDRPPTIHAASEYAKRESETLEVDELQRILLATFRLLNFDWHTFSKTISGAHIQTLLKHEDRAVRYLSVRILCRLLSASDAKLEAMIEEHVGKNEAILGDFDGHEVDYGFLSLLEEQRLQNASKSRLQSADLSQYDLGELPVQVVRYGNTLLPRSKGPPSNLPRLIETATTSDNMELLAKALLSPSPILLHGLAGSGKTSLVNDFARELGMEEDMVTLHLNEQTDAKMLIGMYASGSTPGSFAWRAGILTTAVREGRWVFIEDLDRAPNEVISVILPLIERGELLIPSRGETIKAGRGFRLLASIRTSLNVAGVENPPAPHMLGARLWNRVPVQMPSQNEFREIIDGTYPILHQFLPGILNVYERLYTLSKKPSFASKSRISLGRPISPRDLLKWCRRLNAVLIAVGSKTGQEPISDTTQYEMFLEATDCFAGSLQTEESRRTVISAIAEEMHIDPQRMEHFITAHIPRYNETEKDLVIGRVRLPKRPSRVTKSVKKRPFANTTHAKRLLEQVGVAVKLAEPVLLIGETGIGKTTVVQQLADSIGFKLVVVNLSQQSEVGDLLGGFKPVNVRTLAVPLKDEFDDLFSSTGISATKNQRYLEQLGKCVAKGQWTKASKLWREAPKMFESIILELKKREISNGRPVEQPAKRRKTESRLQSLLELKPRWDKFSQSLDQFDIQLSGGSKGFAFTFIEGNIVKAARNGDWVLLDEINLSSPDTLESIADLLHSGSGSAPSILLTETGEIERVTAHPNFRIFGAMNPATDVGKRDLPLSLRSRFTEIYVDSPDRNLDDLLGVIKAYLKGNSSNDERAAHDVARLYLNTKRLADERRLVDGANQVPHFSLRTLTRVLSYVNEIASLYGLRRALYEGFAMGFLTLLNRESEQMLMPLINHHLLGSHKNVKALLSQTPKHPEDGKQYVPFMSAKKDRHYWLLQGPETPQVQSHYIRTPSVDRNMLNLVRATSTRRFPVLVQGPTSSGKTSMIEYLAKHSGNKFVRINNHEHTDLQEYLGTYISGSDGQLRFQEGLLVQALRQGDWIVLDELNLAPTDVLEALNRLLDDNRELLIPETQEVVRPHENFMLFATQNPPGLYGGRKTLSRAFRNRFLELHFDDIPEDELETILQTRCQNVAPSDCGRIVRIYQDLSKLRQSNRLFEQKESFATLRDLFRWAMRGYDTREQLAANGYMLLAERVRNPEERKAVKEVIEKVMKVKIDPADLYNTHSSTEISAHNQTSNSQGVVWTQAMRRLYVLVAHALRNNEPVLLVGETGCGKTTVCQMLAEAFSKDLHIVNAHQNTETGDLIGAQRPVRNRAAILEQLTHDIRTALGPTFSDEHDLDSGIGAYRASPQVSQLPAELRHRVELNITKSKALFEWSDGNLVQAMREGQYFLLDEISLADDSVLERLNSVLETQRTILLAEKGVDDSFVQAADGFQFFATMNPGGDYGKRELSPALRNRFTEIWVPSLSDHEDVFQIVEAKLKDRFKPFAKAIVQFAEWFGEQYHSSASTSISVRDVLAWVKFMNTCKSDDPYFQIVHGASMVYIDTLGANPAALLAIDPGSIIQERAKCLAHLSSLLQHDISPIYDSNPVLRNETTQFAIGDFAISKHAESTSDPGFAFEAPTTKINAMRVIRALQVQKPILIEGSPGVGKTTLVAALARACSIPLTRINLSEQTDLMDLFGSDVPVEGAEAGHFAWRDAPFLQAMQKGEWVLLDEMNLASQSVLEGLNACLDHRGEVYISELDQTFKRHPKFCVFAAQNPHHQGGGRKGLPGSFVNRFTVVYADVFRNEDLQLICRHNFPSMAEEVMVSIITFVSRLEQEIVHKRRFGSQGGPWEFNLRDILRWLQLLNSDAPFLSAAQPSDLLDLIFRQRFRAPRDRQEVNHIFAEVYGSAPPFRHLFHNQSSDSYQVGLAYMPRDLLIRRLPFPAIGTRTRLAELESIMTCIQQNMPCILVGSSGSGKTTALQHIASMSGNDLVVFPMNADIDTMDLVGGFEQVDPLRAASAFLEGLKSFLESKVLANLPLAVPNEAIELLALLNDAQPFSSLFAILAQNLRSLKSKTSLEEFGKLAETCDRFSTSPMTLENARFEWVDGVLIKALEQGKWLVLDNANLCSASVLDRLNSLLEQNGSLCINEHCGPDGEPKIVKPHSNFRIFLTMDARFGELSRAMRNRAVEIFFDPLPVGASSEFLAARPESSMQRFGNVLPALATNNLQICSIALDHLSWADMPLLSRFVAAFGQNMSVQDISTLSQFYVDLYAGSENQDFRSAIGKSLGALATKTSLAPAAFIDAQVSDRAVPIVDSYVLMFSMNQILHPLQNSPIVSLVPSDEIFWLGAAFDALLEIHATLQAQQLQSATIGTMKPSKMNRYQRSLVKGRVPTVANDSTANVSTFLNFSIQALRSFLQSNTSRIHKWKAAKSSINALLRYWWHTFRLATSPSFEEATFQAHLAIGTDMFSELAFQIDGPSGMLVNIFKESLSQEFSAGFKLTSGLSMELTWKHFRPLVIPSEQALSVLLKMEQLAARFDSLKWRTSISISELGAVMTSLVKAYHLILSSDVDGTSLIGALGAEMDTLEKNVGHENDLIAPFFQGSFETLRQYQSLEVISSSQSPSLDTNTLVLANLPTSTQMRLAASSETSRSLQAIDYLSSDTDPEFCKDSFSASLLRGLTQIDDVDLKSLSLLEAELPILGQTMATSTANLAGDPLTHLNQALLDLVLGVVSLHGDDLAEDYRSWVTTVSRAEGVSARQVSTGVPSHLKPILASHFNAAVLAIQNARSTQSSRLKSSALAWIHFSLSCIQLYIPDCAFDPDKRQKLERERHVSQQHELQTKLASLQAFERLFSGQESNLRCELLEAEILELDEPPEVLQRIYRPEVSEMDKLQGEFTNLLKTVRSVNIVELLSSAEAANGNPLQQIKLLQKNVSQIIRRLSEGFRAYNDITRPAINILRCLQLGLSLAVLHSSKTSARNETCVALSEMTPFLSRAEPKTNDAILSTQPMEYLAFMSTKAMTESLPSFQPDTRQSLLKAFHTCYDEWTKRLETDRVEAESKSGLYRYRGSAEDEDEDDQQQFDELFPVFEETDDKPTANGMAKEKSTRDTAIELSKIHASTFLGGKNAQDSITELIKLMSRCIGDLFDNKSLFSRASMNAALLPGSLLLLKDQLESLSPNAILPASYNFYTNANLPEARKLVALIHKIQLRFHDLQAVDEIGHMQPLQDVLDSSRELLQFRHTEPLAKIITKVEKVHTYMHEWQFGGWASRANTALTLYDEITQTIVSWRRLELSTWAKLFDMETKTCEEDAMSWWFIAYQVVIAVPLQMSDARDELRTYAQKLLKDLETYFSTAILGQFGQRLQLLKQLQKHLELIVLDYPDMSIIHSALSNFIALYSRYEKPVQEHLKKSRASLEKLMKDVLLLASWKDTNIVALRDSAKRSHHKLFKIVRKFRVLLGQPMETILQQGLPDESHEGRTSLVIASTLLYPTVDLSALSRCAETVPTWPEKPKRFVNVSKTVSLMASAAEIPTSAINGAEYLDSFLVNIITSTTELQKATPSVLTEDNKVTVKHLKSRKRKLFAETLKDLRQMGFQYNLSADTLSKQDSLSLVLSTTEHLTDLEIEGMEYYFHKTVDILPRARQATRQHSEDLSSAEVARSLGFLEGMLQETVAQHNTLAVVSASTKKLGAITTMVKGLWNSSFGIQVSKYTSEHEKRLRWMPNILSVGQDLVRIHVRLSKVQADKILQQFGEWIDSYCNFSKQWEALPTLPASIVSEERIAIETEISRLSHLIGENLHTLTEQRPNLGFIFNQILPWTDIANSQVQTEGSRHTIQDLDEKLSSVCDAVLVAVEKHKTSLSSLPSSTEDSNWLVTTDKSLAASLKALYAESITNQIEETFSILSGVKLDDESTSKTATALFAVALPLFQQYFNILDQSVTRYAHHHRATCKATYILSKTFMQIATQGFCTPSEKSDAQDGKTEKLEGGTGLGDGEGAEDISKDIQDDEDLDELAQEPNTGEKNEMEDEQDAVDMADADMEGEIGDEEEKGDDESGSGDEGSGDEMDEEAGDVDDLDPTAVDEKMWDGDGEQAEKDQEGDDSKGKQSNDEQVAAQENGKDAPEGEDGDEGDEEEMVGEEQGEDIKQDETEKHDPDAQDGEALDLPDDMELDGDEDGESVDGSDDGMGDLSDIEDGKEEEMGDGKEEEGAQNMDPEENQDAGSDIDVVDPDEEQDGEGDQTEEAGEKEDAPMDDEIKKKDGLLQARDDDANADADNAVPSDVQGTGEDQNENSEDKADSDSKAQREDGGKGGQSSEDKAATAEDGEQGTQANGDAPQDAGDETQDISAAQPFKKLGDALEKWHRQQTKIRDPAEQKDKPQEQNTDLAKDSAEFQHLQDEDAEPDTQALGTATEEQAHALDESMAVDQESKDMPEQFQPDEVEDDKMHQENDMDLDETEPKEQESSDAYEGRAGAMIKQSMTDRDMDLDQAQAHMQKDVEDVEEMDDQLEHTHLENDTLDIRSAADARQQWTHYEGVTRDLSLSLTEQLRLILAPTLATKMRGDFRTGKRLNIKRIIPYIASSYKRDKIWMRRSVPSKRSYQIMLAVDDSKSMGESGSGALAFETLVMVSKSLSMLEVGEICVVGFGENVRVAHEFDVPFSSDAGPKALQRFGFQQGRTDVVRLVRESIELFRNARAKASGGPADLWQMELIISDGVCESRDHDEIRRLLREALEERIMMIFVIVDDVKNKKDGQSVMDLNQASFVDGKVVTSRYLDTFPFQYYIVVGDVKELPSVLATLLRQWFAEVVDSGR